MADSTDRGGGDETAASDRGGGDETAAVDDERLRQELSDLDARISAVSTRLSLDYGSDTTRDGWRGWLAQMRSRRERVLAQLKESRRT